MPVQILTVISIIFVSILFAAFFAPITICLVITLNRRPMMSVSVKVLMFKGAFAVKKRKAKPSSRKAQIPSDIEQGHRPGISGIRLLRVFIRERKTVGHTIRTTLVFINKLLVSVDRYFLSMDVNGALPSPDQTGKLYGLVSALKAFGSDSLTLSFKPDFAADKLQGNIAIGTTFRLYRIMKELLQFIRKLPKLQLIRVYRFYRKESANV